MTSSIAAVFVPLRSVRIFVLASVAVCVAGVMWIACHQSKPSVSAECLKDHQYQFLAASYCRAGEFDYAESMLIASIALHSRAGCSGCVSQVKEKLYLSKILNKQDLLTEVKATNATACRVHKNCDHDVEKDECGLLGRLEVNCCQIHKVEPHPESGWFGLSHRSY